MHEPHFDDLKSSDADIVTLIDEVENFAEWIFVHHCIKEIRDSKVIHDCVWGTHRYQPYEIALINTPLIQRLRQIHQTANTYYTYPSAKHTRFEHTLGVTSQVGKLITALEEKYTNSKKHEDKKDLLGRELYITLRLAAILHDCGHGPFSHTSEEIYGNYPEIKKLKKLNPFKRAGAGEILSYLIIDSKFFKSVLNKITENISVDPELMKNAIVGFSKRPEDAYKTDMLHGPFDADKIDYLFRDGHFSGLPLQIDLDRLWYALDINYVDKSRRLTIDWGGASSIEQILFSKMTLFPAVYHHHKVRACDCMFKGIIEYIKEKEYPLERDIANKKINIDFKSAADFLYFTDYDFFDWNLCKLDKNLHTLLHDLLYRRVLKRAIVICRDSIATKSINDLDLFTKYVSQPVIVEGLDYYRWLAKKIWDEAGKPGLFQEVWIDCPKDPKFDEASETWISPLDKGQSPVPITSFFDVDKYADQYKLRKWRGHVFCRPENVDKVAAATIKVFKEEFNIEFKPLAFHLCHVAAPSNL